MEDLNKQQLILLALLVSFVASIATSIATASLLDQAPPRVTQTIHRVVERTVETVTPSDKGGGEIVTQEKTVIVREEDAITEAIAVTSPRLVKLYLTVSEAENDGSDATTAELATRFRGTAVAVDADGSVLTTSAAITSASYESYDAILADGTRTTARVQQHRSNANATVLSLDALSTGADFPEPVVFGDTENIKLGQTVLGLGGIQAVSVNMGIVSNVQTNGEGVVTGIVTDITSDTAGMPIVNLFGEIVGLARNENTNTFIPVATVAALLAESS